MATGFDVDKVRDLMRTKPGKAVFWSGTTGFTKPEGMSEEEYRSMTANAGGEDRAKAFARARDGKTLEILMEEHRDELIEAGFPYDEKSGRFVYSDGSPNPDGTPSKWGDTREYWDQISDAFAQGASGQVRVVFGIDENDLREDADGSIHSYESTWQRAELARIKQNPNITSVSAFDPYTEEEIESFTPDEIVLDAKYEPRDYLPETDTAPDTVPSIEEQAAVDAHVEPSFSTGEAVGFGAAAGAAPTVAQSAAHAESSQPVSSQTATLGDRYQSSYADRIRQTPSLESNRWAGERGESVCSPQSDAAHQIMEERGISGVQYQNGIPDFSPFSESTVKLGYMTDARHSQGLTAGRDGKDTIFAHLGDEETVSESHHADKSSMADLHMKYDKPGNFEQADALTAEQWTADGRNGREWTAEDVAQYRQDYGLTWHECNNMETMQMIPEAINADFGHLGGVGEVKETQHIVEEAVRDYDEGQMVEGEDYDRMTPEELETAAREHGHYDDDGVWIPDDLSQDAYGDDNLDKPTDEAGIDLPLEDQPPVDGMPDEGGDNMAPEAQPPMDGGPNDGDANLHDEGLDGGDDMPFYGQQVDGSPEDGGDNPPDEGPDGGDDMPPHGQPVDEATVDGSDNTTDEALDSGDAFSPDNETSVDGLPDNELDGLPNDIIDEIDIQVMDDNSSDINRETEEPVAQEAAEQEVTEQAAQEATEQDAEEQVAQEATEEVKEQAAEEQVAQETAEQDAEEAGEQEVEEQAAQEAAEQEAEEQATKEAAEQGAEEQAAQKVAEQEAEELAAKEAAEQETEEQAAEEAAEQEAEEQAAQEAEEQAAQEVAEQEAEEQAAEEVAEQETEEQAAEEAAEQEAEEQAEQEAEEQATEEAAEQEAEEQAAEEAAEQEAEEQAAEEATEQEAEEQVAQETAEQEAEEQAAEEAAEQEAEELAAEEAAEQEAEESYDALADEEPEEPLDDAEDYSDLEDEPVEESFDDSSYEDFSDEADAGFADDAADYSDMVDDIDSGSFEDTSFDSSDASFDSGDTGSFDGGGDSIE